MFSSLPIEQLYSRLQSSKEGLSDDIATEKMKEQVSFFMPQSRLKKSLKLLIRQFVNPLVLLLVVAVILSSILGESSDSFIILFILIATALLSF